MRLSAFGTLACLCSCSLIRPTAPSRDQVAAEYGLTTPERLECEVQVDMLRSERARTSLGGRTADSELKACVARYDERLRKQKEQDEKRAAEQAAKEEERGRAAALRAATPPEIRRRASSAALCRYGAWRARLIAVADREHRYAAETGVQNLILLQEVKVQLEAVDAAADYLREAFAAKSIEPEQCSVPAVASLQRCVWLQVGGGFQPLWSMSRDEGADCEQADFKPYLAYLGQ